MKGKNNQLKLLKKYCNFLVLIYCHYIINIFNSLIDINDIHYMLLINLFNNYITNIFLKCISMDINLNNIKSILNEGCSIILDYIIISKEEKFNNTNYTPKFTDAIQFSYQKIIHKIENNHLETKLKKSSKFKKSPIIKKKSNKQSLNSKSSLQSLIKKQQLTHSNIQNTNIFINKTIYNTPLQNTSKFKTTLQKCVELINTIFVLLIKTLFIRNNSKSVNSSLLNENNKLLDCVNNKIFLPISYILTDDNCLDTVYLGINDSVNNNNEIINNQKIDIEKVRGIKVSKFFNKLSFNIDIIENYLLILSNEIVILFKENEKQKLENINNIIKLGFTKINSLQLLDEYNELNFDIIYLVYPYLIINNCTNLLINNNSSLLQINDLILNWCIHNNDWIKELYLSTNNQFVNNTTLKKINQHFLKNNETKL
jgi:hypothetical protein